MTRAQETSRFDSGVSASRAAATSWLDQASRRLVHSSLGGLTWGALTVEDDAGRRVFGQAGSGARASLRILSPRAYRCVAWGGALGAAEAYIRGLWESPDPAAVVRVLVENWEVVERVDSIGPLRRLTAPLRNALAWAVMWSERNSKTGSLRNIRAHYDLGNDFFSLFLDPTLMYSCAYFESDRSTLEDASTAKNERLCHKLALEPGHDVGEIGTGWGGFALHAAQRSGCRVTTTTISGQQAMLARQRVSEAGLGDRISIAQRDYRDFASDHPGRFDRLVSIEMIEAVGRSNLGRYFEACSRVLRPDGAMALQAIVIRDQAFGAAARRRDFLKKYIFPGSCLPSLASIADSVRDRTDLRIVDVEDIGPHYVRTLREWRARFRQNLDRAQRLGFSGEFLRTWDYYLCYCEGVFAGRRASDVQVILAKPRCDVESLGLRRVAT